jgi:polyhydroxybutyrate depolymerase
MGTAECAPARPVPICYFHGTADDFAPYAGGRGSRSLTRTEFYSAADTLATWAAANRCAAEPAATPLADRVADGMTVTRFDYRPAADGAPLVHYRISGGGHTWPGRPSIVQRLGPTTRDIDANALMWTFFSARTLPAEGGR